MSESLSFGINTGGLYCYNGEFANLPDVAVSNNTGTPYYIKMDFVPLGAIPAVGEAPAKKEKDEMSRYYDEDLDAYVETVMTDEHKQRIYLRGRLETIHREKMDELSKKFGLMDEDAPTTFDEFVERITVGLYKFDKEEHKENRYWRDYIRWRDPSVKEDKKGYEAAYKLLEKEYVRTCDLISIKSPDDGLDAINAFENWKLKK